MIYSLKQKLTSLILIFQILFSLVGSHLLYNIFENQIKKIIRIEIASGRLTKDYLQFRFDFEEFICLEWENEKEFFIGSNIYDVVESKICANYIEVICYLDWKESDLRLNYTSLLNQLPKSSNFYNSIFSIVQNIFLKFYFQKQTLCFDVKLPFNFSYHFIPKLLSFCNEFPTPPPELIYSP